MISYDEELLIYRDETLVDDSIENESDGIDEEHKIDEFIEVDKNFGRSRKHRGNKRKTV